MTCERMKELSEQVADLVDGAAQSYARNDMKLGDKLAIEAEAVAAALVRERIDVRVARARLRGEEAMTTPDQDEAVVRESLGASLTCVCDEGPPLVCRFHETVHALDRILARATAPEAGMERLRKYEDGRCTWCGQTFGQSLHADQKEEKA